MSSPSPSATPSLKRKRASPAPYIYGRYACCSLITPESSSRKANDRSHELDSDDARSPSSPSHRRNTPMTTPSTSAFTATSSSKGSGSSNLSGEHSPQKPQLYHAPAPRTPPPPTSKMPTMLAPPSATTTTTTTTTTGGGASSSTSTARITAAQAFAQVASARKTRSALSKRPTLVSRMRAEAMGDADADADAESCSENEEDEAAFWGDESSPSNSRRTLDHSSRDSASRTPDLEDGQSTKTMKHPRLDCYSDPAFPERKKLRPCSPRSLRLLRTRSEASLRASKSSTSSAAIEPASEPSSSYTRTQAVGGISTNAASLSVFWHAPSPLNQYGSEGRQGAAGEMNGEEKAVDDDAEEDREEYEMDSVPSVSSPAARLSASQRSAAQAPLATTLPPVRSPTDATGHVQRANSQFRIKTKRALPEQDYYSKFKREESSPSPPDYLHVKARKRQKT